MSIGEKKEIVAPVYQTGNYLDTDEGKVLRDALKKAQGGVTGYGGFSYGRQDQLDSIMDNILNRKPFSYNFNEDALYHQYKDKYIKQGKMASADVMGQAAAMTGGYGNSYAATAGNQAYLAHLENLNDIIPELYQIAYERYKGEGEELANNYGVLSDDYDRKYGKHMDGYSMAKDAYNMALNSYNTGYSNYYDAQDRANALIAQGFADELALGNYNMNLEAHNADLEQANVEPNEDNGGAPGYKTPTAAIYAGALEAYNKGGDAAVEQFLEMYPEYDVAAAEDYAVKYGTAFSKADFKDRNWEAVDDTLNGLWGVDWNDTVTDGVNTYTLRELKDQGGYTDKELKELMKALGLS